MADGGVATQSVTVRDACRMAIDGNVAQRQGCLLQIDSSTQRRVATCCTSAVLDGQVLHQLCLLGGLVCVREGEPRRVCGGGAGRTKLPGARKKAGCAMWSAHAMMDGAVGLV